MKARVITNLNIRTGVPDVLPDNNPGYYRPGVVVDIAETVIGRNYKGNNVWYKLSDGAFVWSGGINKDSSFAFRENFTISVDNDIRKKIISKIEIRNAGKGIVIGLLDSGIDASHPAFDFTNITETNFLSTTEDVAFHHGTSVAGLLVGNSAELSGMAIDAVLKSFRVIKKNNRTDDRALKLALANIANGESDVHIVNLSLEILEFSFSTIQNLIDEIVLRRGGIVVVAGGTLKKENIISKLENVISVGVFEQAEFLEIRNGFPVPDYTVTFLNSAFLTATLSNKYAAFKDSSAYTAIVTGLIAKFLAADQTPTSNRFSKVKEFLKTISFYIHEDDQATEFKIYRNENV